MQQQYVLALLGMLREPGHIFRGSVAVAHLQQCLSTQQVGFAQFLIQRDGLCQTGNALNEIVLSQLGLGIEEMHHRIVGIDGESLLAEGLHLVVVLLHIGHAGGLHLQMDVVGLLHCQRLQLGQSIVEASLMEEGPRQIVAHLGILLCLQRFLEAFHGIFILADTHGLHPVVFQQVEVALVSRFLFFLGISDSPK